MSEEKTNTENTNTEKTGKKKPDLTGLVEVEKDGEKIHVNPVALEQHKQLGWKEC